MKTSAIFVAIAALAGLAVAVPTPEASPKAVASAETPALPSQLLSGSRIRRCIEERQSSGVFVTQDINWGGASTFLPVTRGVCATFVSVWVNSITSFGPDAGLSCHLFDLNGCTGESIGPIVSPGSANLGNIGWNDKINSFRCV
ncbi:hypothetical protein B0T21DRAFT_407855 [Apiosordaria backusii]|uniref:Uncharacterized protein n=1 Tax=Apiosordaria backusii TaxID=314023 RepID=A0AA40K3P7_9PEZI|nr:hypothetical protein B0T21DRAFT_407855 [Apiosordaria backusii]